MALEGRRVVVAVAVFYALGAVAAVVLQAASVGFVVVGTDDDVVVMDLSRPVVRKAAHAKQRRASSTHAAASGCHGNGRGLQWRLASGRVAGSIHSEEQMVGERRVARTYDQQRDDEEEKKPTQDVGLRVVGSPAGVEIEAVFHRRGRVGPVGGALNRRGHQVWERQDEAHGPHHHDDDERREGRLREITAADRDDQEALHAQRGQGCYGDRCCQGFHEAAELADEETEGPVGESVPRGVERHADGQHQKVSCGQVHHQGVVSCVQLLVPSEVQDQQSVATDPQQKNEGKGEGHSHCFRLQWRELCPLFVR